MAGMDTTGPASSCDVAIIGGGSAGLALAATLARSGLDARVVERRDEAALAEPADDGREIALTRHSVALLDGLGAWARVPAATVSPMRAARVLNGPAPTVLRLDPRPGGIGRNGPDDGTFGRFVPNAVLRRALFRTAREAGAIVTAGTELASLTVAGGRCHLALTDATALDARVAVAADGRLSPTRRAAGIGAAVSRFGQRVVVCRMRHERPHDGISTAWFDYGRILSILPLNGKRCSAVLSLPDAEAAALLALDEPDFSARVTALFRRRLGAMHRDDTPHSAPVVTTYAERFHAPRLALLGDAAVGMHPVTAHGFNLGLTGADLLGRALVGARRADRDIGGEATLGGFARAYRRATWLPYQATTAIVRFYGAGNLPARLLRHAGLAIADALPPIRSAVAARLAES